MGHDDQRDHGQDDERGAAEAAFGRHGWKNGTVGRQSKPGERLPVGWRNDR
jgi:hypothetical protein